MGSHPYLTNYKSSKIASWKHDWTPFIVTCIFILILSVFRTPSAVFFHSYAAMKNTYVLTMRAG